VDHLVDVDGRMEKKQHMRWTRSGAQILFHARCALINGELGKYTRLVGKYSVKTLRLSA